jgi:hypothetical protein
VVKQKVCILLILLVLTLFTSCDLFWSMPWGKSPADPTSQVGVVRAVRAGDSSMVVVWDWRPFLKGDPVFAGLDFDEKREIEELRILHGTGSPPAFSLPMPWEERYINRTDPEGWFMVFENLKEDREHYFSIYGKEKSGQWVGPWTVSRHMDGGVQTGSISQSYNDAESFSISFDKEDIFIPAGPFPPGPPYNVDSLAYPTISAVVLWFDHHFGGGFITSATATISCTTTFLPATITIWPLRHRWDGNVDEISRLYNTLVLDDVGKIVLDVIDGVNPIPDESARLLFGRMALLGAGACYVEADPGFALTINSFSANLDIVWD